MAVTVTMLSPSPAPSSVQTRFGNTYTPDINGVIIAKQADILDLMGAGFTLLGVDQARNNFAAVTDPGAGNDVTQDYAPGSWWFNTTLNRLWLCQSAATGAAIWYFDGIVIGAGNEPSGITTQFGSSTAGFAEEGNLNRQIGNPIAQPAGTGSDYVLAQYSLPASAFDISGRGLALTGAGLFAANTNSKRVKLWFNATIAGGIVTAGTVVADSGASTGNNVGWTLLGNAFKYGAAGSNTQYCQSTGIIIGNTSLGINLPSFATAVESAAITVAVTGNPTTAATDISLNFFEVNAMN